MAEILKSNVLRDSYPEPAASGGNDAYPVHAVLEITKALVANDVCEMFVVPPGYVVHDLMIGCDDLDTDGSAAIVLAVGKMKGTPGDVTFINRTTANAIGTEFISGSNIGQAGGTARMNLMAGMEIKPQDEPYSVGVQVTTPPATGATSGTIVVNALLRPAFRGL